ncbi:unnamed protein product [Bursaphelenchus okinawaensis]|uniref:Protein sleepless n=1 Tax=Bursaphelenchus okinawaensis TaxID=465554 RepID=A0A811KCH2_9BILA|nr:unnamed protein product [Bursaphelenchus okinawaensis]CAG9098237.1 unnamed protein product [Bursaphelenchus okinawaensis]
MFRGLIVVYLVACPVVHTVLCYDCSARKTELGIINEACFNDLGKVEDKLKRTCGATTKCFMGEGLGCKKKDIKTPLPGTAYECITEGDLSNKQTNVHEAQEAGFFEKLKNKIVGKAASSNYASFSLLIVIYVVFKLIN